jgi:hypothetical protein
MISEGFPSQYQGTIGGILSGAGISLIDYFGKGLDLTQI